MTIAETSAVLKAELHAHSSEDPHDTIPYDAKTLIDRAAGLGYGAVAVTLHDRQLDVRGLDEHARDRAVLLVRGIERTISGKHVLLLNFPASVEGVTTFEELARLKARSNGLVIAPHPFFPTGSCLRGLLDRYADLFDAIELNAFYTGSVDFNRRAVAWAARHGKPVVGNGDIHRLWQLGTTYSLIDAPADADALCEAVRAGRVEVHTRPISLADAVWHLGDLYSAELFERPERPRYPVMSRTAADSGRTSSCS